MTTGNKELIEKFIANSKKIVGPRKRGQSLEEFDEAVETYHKLLEEIRALGLEEVLVAEVINRRKGK